MTYKFDTILGAGRDDSVSAGSIVTALDNATTVEMAQIKASVSGDKIPMAQKGAANGVASLGSDAKVPASQIPDVAILRSGGNFIPNGLCESVVAGQAVTNFPNFTADFAYVPPGVFASYKLTSTAINKEIQKVLSANVLIPGNKLLEISTTVTMGDIDTSSYIASGVQHLAVSCYDTDGNEINEWMSRRYGSSELTTLAVALNPGDTTMTLTSAAGWCNAGDWYNRQFVWWPKVGTNNYYGYVENTGKYNPPYGYSRNVARNTSVGVWAAGGISGNVITLTSPWAGPAIAAGTPVRNSDGGGARLYYHVISNQPAGHTTTTKTISANIALSPDIILYHGTSSINIYALLNYLSSQASPIRISSVVVRIK